ncbi:hypothetical protein FISHEDRAFT_78168 [Fistulina hepatica ATCC 64428]|nr:hypothetical protein FISHEDRAFT_78168 [Fistulina hepatica ATCC 64428]
MEPRQEVSSQRPILPASVPISADCTADAAKWSSLTVSPQPSTSSNFNWQSSMNQLVTKWFAQERQESTIRADLARHFEAVHAAVRTKDAELLQKNEQISLFTQGLLRAKMMLDQLRQRDGWWKQHTNSQNQYIAQLKAIITHLGGTVPAFSPPTAPALVTAISTGAGSETSGASPTPTLPRPPSIPAANDLSTPEPGVEQLQRDNLILRQHCLLFQEQASYLQAQFSELQKIHTQCQGVQKQAQTLQRENAQLRETMGVMQQQIDQARAAHEQLSAMYKHATVVNAQQDMQSKHLNQVYMQMSAASNKLRNENAQLNALVARMGERIKHDKRSDLAVNTGNQQGTRQLTTSPIVIDADSELNAQVQQSVPPTSADTAVVPMQSPAPMPPTLPTHASLAATVQVLTTQLARLAQANASVVEDRNRLAVALHERENALAVLTDEYSRLQSAKAELEQERDKLDADHANASCERRTLQTVRDDLEDERDALAEERDEARFERDEVARTLALKQTQCDSAVSERDVALSEKTNLQQQLEHVTVGLSDAESRYANAKDEYERVRQECLQTQSARDALTEQLKALEEELMRMRTAETASQTERAALKEELQKAKKKVERALTSRRAAKIRPATPDDAENTTVSNSSCVAPSDIESPHSSPIVDMDPRSAGTGKSATKRHMSKQEVSARKKLKRSAPWDSAEEDPDYQAPPTHRSGSPTPSSASDDTAAVQTALVDRTPSPVKYVLRRRRAHRRRRAVEDDKKSISGHHFLRSRTSPRRSARSQTNSTRKTPKDTANTSHTHQPQTSTVKSKARPSHGSHSRGSPPSDASLLSDRRRLKHRLSDSIASSSAQDGSTRRSTRMKIERTEETSSLAVRSDRSDPSASHTDSVSSAVRTQFQTGDIPVPRGGDAASTQHGMANEGNVEYEVDSITAVEMVNGKQMYCVLWKGYDETTWEPRENLEDTEALDVWLMGHPE